MNKEYYEGMFTSLKHNILVQLSQIEGNIEFAEGVNVSKELDFIIRRCFDIKDKFAECTEDEEVENGT